MGLASIHIQTIYYGFLLYAGLQRGDQFGVGGIQHDSDPPSGWKQIAGHAAAYQLKASICPDGAIWLNHHNFLASYEFSE